MAMKAGLLSDERMQLGSGRFREISRRCIVSNLDLSGAKLLKIRPALFAVDKIGKVRNMLIICCLQNVVGTAENI